MKRKKTFLFTASIIEIVVSCIFLLCAVMPLIDWLVNFMESGNNLTEMVVTVCVCLALAIFMIVDGIISLRISKASDDRFTASKNTNLAMGIVYLVLAVFALFTFAYFYFFVGVIMVLAFIIFIIVGVFNILSSTLPEEKGQETIAEKQDPVVKPESPKKEVESTLSKLERINELYKSGLITEDEFIKIKNKILSSD